MEVGECVGATGGATCSTLTATTTRGSTAGTPTDHSQLLAASGDAVSSHDGQKEGNHLCYFLGVWLGDFCVNSKTVCTHVWNYVYTRMLF